MNRLQTSEFVSDHPLDSIQERERKRKALESLLRQMSQKEPSSTAPRLLIESKSQSGPHNMAVDEALLESVSQGGPASFRLYTWSDATISLGYFQRKNPEIELGGPFHGLPVVRRLSGGGAILHHHELTYSCCIPPSHLLAEDPSRLYDEMHARIQAALSDCGIEVTPRGEVEGKESTFLCFARGDRRDLICRGFKVVGSAQRRRKGAILQHGSILLRRSALLPEHPGVFDLENAPDETTHLKRRLAYHCSRLLGVESKRSELTSSEIELTVQLERERYSEFIESSDEAEE